MPRHSIAKLLKCKDKNKIIEAVKRMETLPYKGNKIESAFLKETIKEQ